MATRTGWSPLEGTTRVVFKEATGGPHSNRSRHQVTPIRFGVRCFERDVSRVLRRVKYLGADQVSDALAIDQRSACAAASRLRKKTPSLVVQRSCAVLELGAILERRVEDVTVIHVYHTTKQSKRQNKTNNSTKPGPKSTLRVTPRHSTVRSERASSSERRPARTAESLRKLTREETREIP